MGVEENWQHARKHQGCFRMPEIGEWMCCREASVQMKHLVSLCRINLSIINGTSLRNFKPMMNEKMSHRKGYRRL